METWKSFRKHQSGEARSLLDVLVLTYPWDGTLEDAGPICIGHIGNHGENVYLEVEWWEVTRLLIF